MVEKIKKNYLKYPELFFAFMIFVFFLIIFFLAPINGDDWGNYIIGTRGIRGWIGQAIGMYFDWEGRFVSRLLINMLTYHKWLWCLFNATLMVILYLLTIKLIRPKEVKIISILYVLGILLIGHDIFTQTYIWIAGNLTYFTPLVLVVIYLYLMDCYVSNKVKNKAFLYTVSFGLNLLIPMFVESAGAVLVVVNAFLLIYFIIKSKRLNPFLVGALCISLTSFLAMLLSPGTASRILYEASEFHKAPILTKIIINIPNFIYYTLIGNNFLLLALSVALSYMVIKKISNRSFRLLLLLLINVIPVMVIVLNFAVLPALNNMFLIDIIRKLSFLHETNVVMIIYWCFYLLLLLSFVIICFKDRPKVIFFILIGLIANGVMLLSPIWGARTTLFTVYMLLFVTLFVFNDMISEVKSIKPYVCVGKLLVGIIMFLYIILYYNVNYQNHKRLVSINKQLGENKPVIEIEQIPDYAVWGINPSGEYHIKTFKEYYNIPKEKDIQITPCNYKFFIFYVEEES